MTSKLKEGVMQGVFTLCACVSILAVVLICGFLFVNGFPAIAEIGPLKFLTGLVWKPQEGEFGILPMIVGSIYATGIAILVGVPIGLLCSVFMARFCPGKLYKILKPAISLLAGIPSIVYGFFGLVVLVPIMQSIFGVGKSVLTAGILLGIIEIFGKSYISTELGDAIVFAILIVILLVKPAGLLGKKIREKV
mgnify:CR=1 FL=1